MDCAMAKEITTVGPLISARLFRDCRSISGNVFQPHRKIKRRR
jgi:hypothetical protein